MTTFGTDFAGFDDVDALWSFETDETKAMQQCIARSLIDHLFYDASDDGFDLRQLVGDNVDPDFVARKVDARVKRDQRVSSSLTTVSLVGEQAIVAVQVTASTGGTFTLTIQVDSVTVKLLES